MMTDQQLATEVAMALCQYRRFTRDMPGPDEIQRALPRAQRLVALVRENTPAPAAADATRRYPAWGEGYDAFHADKSEIACPYGLGSGERVHWLTGFAAARDEARHETNGTSPGEMIT